MIAARTPIAVGTAAATALVAWLYVRTLRAESTIPGLRAAGVVVGAVPRAAMQSRTGEVARAYLAHPMRFLLQGQATVASRQEVGFTVDRTELERRLLGAGRSGFLLGDLRTRAQARRGRLEVAVPAALDRTRALEFLSDLKDRLDRPPSDAKLDLEHHTIAREQAGTLVQVYQSLVNLEYAVAAGADQVELAAVVTPPRVTQKDLAAIDISTVMGAWQTAYSMAAVDSDRTYNLKVGAGKVDGTVIRPHETLSFNQVTGDRTEKEGYRVAPVILAGELIDGLAGGMCQIASTLHAAAWFAGLDIVEATPHSRPSAYITMGLDATVVYPTVDLKLRNPYEFPVVIHYRVNQGFVRAEILGRPRGRKVAFEREILEQVAFSTERREDKTMPGGQQTIDQEGHEGFRIKRRRIQYEKRIDQPLDKPEERVIVYPPTTHFVRVGTGSASLPRKPVPPAHHIPNPEKPNTKEGFFRLVR
ncbi:MAG TPA: VanW family protein [Polyangia bacterium]|nr:VanW family protein [Polyangia bacterium]